MPEDPARRVADLRGEIRRQLLQDEWMILGQQTPQTQGGRALRPAVDAAHQNAIGQQSVDEHAIGTDGAFGVGERALRLKRGRRRQPHRVALTGSGDEQYSACPLLELIARHGARLPIDRLAEALGSRARPARLHLVVHIDAARPAPNQAVDDERFMDIERAVCRGQELDHAHDMGTSIGNCEGRKRKV
jgi:hypothetical protein